MSRTQGTKRAHTTNMKLFPCHVEGESQWNTNVYNVIVCYQVHLELLKGKFAIILDMIITLQIANGAKRTKKSWEMLKRGDEFQRKLQMTGDVIVPDAVSRSEGIYPSRDDVMSCMEETFNVCYDLYFYII